MVCWLCFGWRYSRVVEGVVTKTICLQSRGSCKIGHQSKKILDSRPLNPATNVRRKSGPTNRESLTWNMELSLHLCSAPLVAWEGLPRHFMPVFPTSYPSNDRLDRQQQWDWSSAKSAFLWRDQQLCAFVELDQVPIMHAESVTAYLWPELIKRIDAEVSDRRQSHTLRFGKCL